MKRNHIASDLLEEPETAPSNTKRSKLAEDASDDDSVASNGKNTDTSNQSNGKGEEKSRDKGTESDSSAPSSRTRSATPKRAVVTKTQPSRSVKNTSTPTRAKSKPSKAAPEPTTDLSPVLQVVPNYVDWVLLPGTTLTIHRKEFVDHELRYTAKIMATKLSSKVSRAIKRGDYTPRSQLAANAPLQRPNPLCPPQKPLPDPLHPIAKDLRENRKEPPRPVNISF